MGDGEGSLLTVRVENLDGVDKGVGALQAGVVMDRREWGIVEELSDKLPFSVRSFRCGSM